MTITKTVTLALLLNSAFIDSSLGDTKVQQQKGSPHAQQADKYQYKVIRIKNGIYLKLLGKDSKAFGPFKKHDKEGQRYIYIPKDRPQQFGSARQIYRDKKSNKWFFTDNWVHMRALSVNPNGVLQKK